MWRLKNFITKIREAITRRFEYYLANDGRIRVRRATGPNGLWMRVNGKLVKMSAPAMTISDMTIIPWKECNSGYYDEEFGCYVESKQHYRQLMKIQGLIPAEPVNYCGSVAERRRKMIEYQSVKDRPQAEKVFIEAVRKAEAQGINVGEYNDN